MTGHRILMATDLSENAAPAAKTAVELADLLEASVAVLHVIDLTLWRNRNLGDIWRNRELRERMEGRVAAWFEEAAGRPADKVIVETGAAERAIRLVVEDEKIDSLVISMSGRGAWNRLIFGSTAMNLTNPPPTELIVVHPDGTSFRRGMVIGVGTDFTKAADVALERAVTLARQFDSPLHVVHSSALPSTTVITDEELPEGIEHTAVIEWADKEMIDYLEKHADLLLDLEVHTHVIAEPPVHGLRGMVEEFGIDWMILGHRTSKERRGSASVKGKWVQQMNCSTLLVPWVESK